ncbi:MAG: DUF1349 domain-containing protein [Alphaproteobacteria bacterium]|nr:DUF1349 domain-containing protein [Alphaproteobacteria bacterium]
MLLENIKNFNWLNEPQNVGFIEEGLLITAKPETDFWQNADYNFYKDNGHLFSVTKDNNFVITAKWQIPVIKDSAQCGIMIRYDSATWIKVGILSPNPYKPQIGTVVANNGSSDWSVVELPEKIKSIWYRIRRHNNDFIIFYSLDGIKYTQIRMLHLSKVSDNVNAGAYVCSPKNDTFECVLEDIDVQDTK